MQKRIGIIRQRIVQHKTLVQNFSYLASIQIVNLIVTLATYPFLIRILGKETFGLVVFAQAIIGYFVILVSFGFNFSATKEISVHRNNKEKINEIFSSILILKCCLFCISFLLLVTGSFFIERLRDHKLLFLFSMFACFYEFIYPSWYFQGKETMKQVAKVTLLAKLIFLFLILLFVKDREDYLLVPLFNGVGSLVAGFFSVYLIVVKEKVKFSLQPLHKLIGYFKSSISFFISNISIQIYVNANKVIIGTFLGMVHVAYYDLAEKVVLILKLPQAILTQSIFPKISKDQNWQFIKQMFFFSTAGNIVIYVLIIILAPFVIHLLGSTDMSESVNILRILSLTIPINGISSFLCLQVLIPFGHSKAFTKIILSSLFFYVFTILALYFSESISLYRVSLVTVGTEVYTMILVLFYVKRNRLYGESNLKEIKRNGNQELLSKGSF